MQCLPTLAITRKETGSLKYPAIQLGYMSGLAYVAAFCLYRALLMAGWS
jgi:ferrous iron transport protein B